MSKQKTKKKKQKQKSTKEKEEEQRTGRSLLGNQKKNETKKKKR